MKRDLINEIQSVKSRAEFNSRYDISNRLDKIEYAINENLSYNGDFDDELLKYVPIATVACFEAFFRSVIKELVDFGKPFSDNVVKFNQTRNVKFDFDIINAIQSKMVTVGEFISHILPCNNFEDINSNLTTITGNDFADALQKFKKQYLFDDEVEDSLTFSSNAGKIFSDLKRTFELRHIFCHEFATNFKIDREEIFRCFNSAKLFLMQTNDFIWHLLYPNAPLTQGDMNAQAADDYQKADEEFSELILQIRKVAPEHSELFFDDNLFDEAINQWKVYRNAKAKSDTSGFKGGSMYPMVYSISLTNTTKEKIESLKKEFEIDLRRYVSR